MRDLPVMMRFLWILVFLAGALPVRADVAVPGSLDAMLDVLAAALEAEGADGVEVDRAGEAVVWLGPDGRSATASPHNLLRDLRLMGSDAARAAALDMFVRAMLSPPDIPFALEAVFPIVRNVDYAAHLRAQAGGAGPAEPIVADLFGDLSLVWVVDAAEAIRVVTKGDLLRAGVEQAALVDAAEQNLLTKLEPLQLGGDGPLYFLQLDGFYESSALLSAEVWDNLKAALGASPVVAVVARDIVLVGRADDPGELEGLKAARAGLVGEEGAPLSDHLYVWRGGRWRAVPQ